MPKAVIEFDEIFLFGVRHDSLTVLAPANGHQTFFSGPGYPRTCLTNHVVTLLMDGKPAVGTLHRDTEPYMVHLDDVLGKDAYRMKNPNQLGSLVAARYELGGPECWVQSMSLAAAPGDEKYILKEWSFGTQFAHLLTNRARFVVELRGGSFEFKIEDRSTGSSQTVPVRDGDMFLAQSADVPAFSAANVVPRTTLEEFALFYELLVSHSGSQVQGPVPSVDSPLARAGSPFSVLCIRPGCPNAACAG